MKQIEIVNSKEKGEGMEKIRDFIYDVSDLITVACIVVVAIFVIASGVGNIMEYPKLLLADVTNSENKHFGLAVPMNNQSEDPADSENNQASHPEINGGDPITPNPGSSEIEMFSIYINYGESLDSIAEKMVAVGFFSNKEEFINMATEMQASEKIKAGNFIIASNTSKTDVITKLTISPPPSL